MSPLRITYKTEKDIFTLSLSDDTISRYRINPKSGTEINFASHRSTYPIKEIENWTSESIKKLLLEDEDAINGYIAVLQKYHKLKNLT